MCQPKNEVTPIARHTAVIAAAMAAPTIIRKEDDELNVTGPGNCSRISLIRPGSVLERARTSSAIASTRRPMANRTPRKLGQKSLLREP